MSLPIGTIIYKRTGHCHNCGKPVKTHFCNRKCKEQYSESFYTKTKPPFKTLQESETALNYWNTIFEIEDNLSPERAIDLLKIWAKKLGCEHGS